MSENSDKPKEKEKKEVSKSNLSEKSAEKNNDSRRNDKLLLFAGIPVSVIIAMIIQYLYNNYYVLPMEERTLFNVVKFETNEREWSVGRNSTNIEFGFNNRLTWNFEMNSNVDLLKANGQFGNMKVGDLDFKYVIRKESWKIECSLAAHSPANAEFLLRTTSKLLPTEEGFKGTDGVLGNFSVSVSNIFSIDDDSTALFTLKPGDILQLHLNTDTNIVAGSFGDHYKVSENAFNELFENIFQLTAKGMPEFYQTMGRSALSMVISSLESQEQSFVGKGFYNSWIKTEKTPFTWFKKMDGDANSQVLSAVPLVDVSAASIEQILLSFFNLVNLHGNIPSNVTSVLDYTSPPAVSLFYLANLYSEKNGVENLKPIYSNIEKIGLKLLNDNVGRNYEGLLESPSSPKVVSVEHHCLLVLASRALKKLSATYGDAETRQKFSDLSQKIDSIEFLMETFFDCESNRFMDYIMDQKEGKEIKTFVGTPSLAPLMFTLIPAESEQVKLIIQDLENPEVFWSTYGIRSENGVSLAKNFQILKALHFYSHQSSSNQDAAHALYAKLRNTLIMYVARDFKRSGTFWETYSTDKGEGQGQRNYLPSATVLHILAELF